MFAEPYRSIEDQYSTFVGDLTKERASKFALAGYFAMGLVFVVSVSSYSLFDSLKNQVTTISSENSGASCEMISAVSTTKDLRNYLDMTDFNSKYNSEFVTTAGCHTTTGGSISGIGELEFNNAFYLTLDDCRNSVAKATWNVSRGWTDGYVWYYLDNMPSSFGVTNVIFEGNEIYCSSTYLPSNDEFLNFMIAKGFQSTLIDGICDSFVSNPPYKCTKFQTKSYVEILSQSFAIATTFIAVFFALTRAILENFNKATTSNKVDCDQNCRTKELNSPKNTMKNTNPELITSYNNCTEADDKEAIVSEREPSSLVP